VERRKLALAPRSVPATPTAGSAEPSENGSTSNSIFGSAKPIDTAAREREAEERLQARNEERKKAREEESKRQKEEADKGRQLADEKAKMIKDAQEKARLEAMGVPANAANAANGARAPAGAARGRGGPPATRGRGAWGAPAGPQRKSSTDKAKPVVTEDGFEGVTKGAKRAEVDPAPKPKKDTTTRQGFSFAAAAGRVGVVEDEEDKEDVPTIAAPVDEVTNGVKEVSVE
jgi:translation initiation factor 4B